MYESMRHWMDYYYNMSAEFEYNDRSLLYTKNDFE